MSGLTFANPWGLLALFGVPAVLLIHFLQRESRRVVVSTLFLLEQMTPVSARGRRLERLRNSVPLWLQLFAVLLIAWLFAEPRWVRRDSAQSIVVVLDSSVSMSVFREAMNRGLETRLGELSKAAARTEWVLMESDTTRGTLYSGGDLDALLAALQSWKPHLGTHDALPALRIAQSSLRGNGLVIFVSDHPCELPESALLFAVGEPFNNCGFSGLRVETRNGQPLWHALVKNYGGDVQKRSWWIETNGQKTAPNEITLQPDQALELSSAFLANARECELVLSGDRFALDDRLPMLAPQPKPLAISAESETSFDDFFKRFIASLDAVNGDLRALDLQLCVYDPLAPKLQEKSAIIFVKEPGEPKKYLEGTVVAENHPLVSELNWRGLLCKETLRVPPKEHDETLLWQGERPLLFLRGEGDAKSLIVNFDVRQSNALQLPAFVIALNRFVESVREAKVAFASENVETNQAITVAANPAEPPPRIAFSTERMLRAPAEPGFFDVKQGDNTLLRAAAHFADPREADFRAASSVDQLHGKIAALVERNSREDFLAPVWALLLGVAMLGNWAWISREP